MGEIGLQDFRQLGEQEQSRYRECSRQISRLAESYSIPVFFTPPVSAGGKINGGSGCILSLDSGCFLITANHVLAKYEERAANGEPLNWQIGALPPIDPIPRISWRNAQRDIVFLRLSKEEARAACRDRSIIASASCGWPPAPPQPGQMVIFAGFPSVSREVDAGLISSGSFSMMYPVTTAGEGYFVCQIEQDQILEFNGAEPPPSIIDLGGLSGGPVLLMAEITYPLVGIFIQQLQMGNLYRVATLDGIAEHDLR